MELGSPCHFLMPVRPPNPPSHIITNHNSRIKLYSVNTTKPASAKRLQKYKDAGIDFLPLTRPAPFDLETEEEYLEEMRKREGRDPIE
jgi:sulfite oxidase